MNLKELLNQYNLEDEYTTEYSYCCSLDDCRHTRFSDCMYDCRHCESKCCGCNR